MKKCPFCAEEIQDEAIVCRYCGRDLPTTTTRYIDQPVQQQQPAAGNKPKKSLLNRLLPFAIIAIFLCALCNQITSNSGTGKNKPKPTETVKVSSNVVIRTFTPGPTSTPLPTQTPIPTLIPTNTPEPIFLVQTGDAVFNIQKWDGPAILKIKHTGARNFIVRNYPDLGNDPYDLLVNTIGAYEGIVPLDFREGEQTTRFEVKADGAWEFKIEPLTNARREQVPSKFSGNGDDVIILEGGTPDLLKIDASQARRNFVVKAVANGQFDLIVNEIAPYSGTNLLDPSTILLIVHATGPWNLEVTAR